MFAFSLLEEVFYRIAFHGAGFELTNTQNTNKKTTKTMKPTKQNMQKCPNIIILDFLNYVQFSPGGGQLCGLSLSLSLMLLWLLLLLLMLMLLSLSKELCAALTRWSSVMRMAEGRQVAHCLSKHDLCAEEKAMHLPLPRYQNTNCLIQHDLCLLTKQHCNCPVPW